MATGSYLSIITLNVNGLNAPTKRQRLAEWIQKQDPYIYRLQETHLETRDTCSLKVKGRKKIFHANRDQKKAGVAILIPNKIDFKTKAVKRDKEGHYRIDQRINPRRRYNNYQYICTQHRSTAICKTNANKYEGEINNNTIIVETLTPDSHLWIDQLNRKLTRKHKL